MRKMLLCVDGSEYSRSAADYAFQLAKKIGASIRALYVQDSRLRDGPLMLDISGVLGASPYLGFVPQMEKLLADKARQIELELKERARSLGIDLEFKTETGRLVSTIIEHENDADLVVIGKRGEHEDEEKDREMIGPSVEWIVRRSVKPCLVTPDNRCEILRVAAAYDGSAHAAVALHQAIDLVRAMKLSLSIVTVRPIGEPTETWDAVLAEGRAIVKAEGLKCDTYLAHGHADHEILQYCNDTEIDLLVMGAYGHTRIREFLMGSTTFQVLLNAEIPVFLMR